MATYAQLAAEEVWRAQYAPNSISDFTKALGQRGITAYIGGDNNHLTGRHRSMRWCVQSKYCTDRSYGTVDPRDTAGLPDVYRATDVMLAGDRLESVCRRLDTAVRAGQLPGLAEWFGTFDSVNVVGWFEGHESSSDDSHLTHLHLGYWTTQVNDPSLFAALLAIIDDRPIPTTTEDIMFIGQLDHDKSLWLCNGMVRREISEGEAADLKQLAREGLITLANGGEVRPGLVDAFGLDVATLGGGSGVGGLPPHTHAFSGTTGPAQPVE